jgi:DNA (cytosine-5)-methyltransferase 1
LEIIGENKVATEMLKLKLRDLAAQNQLNASRMNGTRQPSVLDIFCGAGGFSEGFRQAGFEIVAGIDNDSAALKTYANNFTCAKALNIDLSGNTNSMDKIAWDAVPMGVEVIIGGPPCQGLSISGPRNHDDPRNKLFLSFVRLTDILKPRAFVLENVPGIFGLYQGKIKQAIISEFGKIGYVVSSGTLSAADYGVPQLRKRAFFVGIRRYDERFLFPAATHFESTSIFSNGNSAYISCEAAVSDLPSLEDNPGGDRLPYDTPPMNDYQKVMREGSECIHNHVATQHTEIVRKIISLVPEGGNYKDLPPEYSQTRNFHVAWTRYHSNKPAPTIDTGHRHHFHYKYNRVPTVRENARLQSFPDTFIFYGNKSDQYRQVGNAVPPLLAKAVATELGKWL